MVLVSNDLLPSFEMRALVTGGGGYVGGRLCTALHDRGYVVTAVDVHFLDEEKQDGVKKVKVELRTQ